MAIILSIVNGAIKVASPHRVAKGPERKRGGSSSSSRVRARGTTNDDECDDESPTKRGRRSTTPAKSPSVGSASASSTAARVVSNAKTSPPSSLSRTRAALTRSPPMPSYAPMASSSHFYPLKPILEVGAVVYAAYWPPTDVSRISVPSWYPGVISSRRWKGGDAATVDRGIRPSSSSPTIPPSHFRGVRLYDIDFDDGDAIADVPDLYVFPAEEYVLSLRPSAWLGVANVTATNDDDGNGSDCDEYSKIVGWYVVTIDGVRRSYSLLSDALRAYDADVVRKWRGGGEGRTKMTRSDLNLPEDWTGLLSFDDDDDDDDHRITRKASKVDESAVAVGGDFDGILTRRGYTAHIQAHRHCNSGIHDASIAHI
jgi:hypothetical protein